MMSKYGEMEQKQNVTKTTFRGFKFCMHLHFAILIYYICSRIYNAGVTCAQILF